MPLRILAAALDNLGDFPFKNPGEVRFPKRALFVRGTHSKYIPDEALPIIGQFFPRFELADIDAGHWVISEKPEAFREGTCSQSIGTDHLDWTELTHENSRGGIPKAERRLDISLLRLKKKKKIILEVVH